MVSCILFPIDLPRGVHQDHFSTFRLAEEKEKTKNNNLSSQQTALHLEDDNKLLYNKYAISLCVGSVLYYMYCILYYTLHVMCYIT